MSCIHFDPGGESVREMLPNPEHMRRRDFDDRIQLDSTDSTLLDSKKFIYSYL